MLTIAWDVDDVLNNLMYTWLEEWWKPKNTDCMLKHEDLTENPPHQLLGVELNEYLQSLDAFRLSGDYEDMLPSPKVFEWFKEYGPSFQHIALTSVPRVAAPASASWVISHFGDWIRTFHFIPSPRPTDIHTDYEITKADYLRWLGRVNIFIDDHPGNVRDVKSLGIRSILLSRPWNSGGIKIEKILELLTSKCQTFY